MSFRDKVRAVGVWFAAVGLIAIGCLTGAVQLPAASKTVTPFENGIQTPAARAVAIMEADWHIPVKHQPAVEPCGCTLGKLLY